MHSGFIHIGTASVLYGLSEDWAAENGKTYGYMHVYLMFPTYEVTTVDGRTIRVVDHGWLTALDDHEVRDLAASTATRTSCYGSPRTRHCGARRLLAGLCARPGSVD